MLQILESESGADIENIEGFIFTFALITTVNIDASGEEAKLSRTSSWWVNLSQFHLHTVSGISSRQDGVLLGSGVLVRIVEAWVMVGECHGVGVLFLDWEGISFSRGVTDSVISRDLSLSERVPRT